MASSSVKFRIKIFLYEISPQIWRRFTVSGNATFAELHTLIQQSMGWDDKQQHEFRYGKGKKLTDVIGPKDDDIVVEGDFKEESKVILEDFLNRKKMPFRMLYRYDFLEDWVHEVVIEKKEEMDESTDVEAEFLEGERACPPEDCGGAWGYMSAMEGDVEWMDDTYDPDAFDPDAVNLKI